MLFCVVKPFSQLATPATGISWNRSLFAEVGSDVASIQRERQKSDAIVERCKEQTRESEYGDEDSHDRQEQNNDVAFMIDTPFVKSNQVVFSFPGHGIGLGFCSILGSESFLDCWVPTVECDDARMVDSSGECLTPVMRAPDCSKVSRTNSIC